MPAPKTSMGRTLHPDPNWQKKMEAARTDGGLMPTGADSLLSLCWAQGFGPRATAMLLDLYADTHPDTIEAKANP